MNNNNGLQAPLTFGLDIGIASVGWAVLSSERIVNLGVRAFDKAETADRGESLNLQRRTARLMRRRLWRRAWRMTKLGRVLRREGLIADPEFFKCQPNFVDSTWALRRDGLDRLLTPLEWARVLYHLCKHRGFHWVSKAEERQAEGDAKSESGRVKSGLARTKSLMESKGYRSAAEMVLTEFPSAQRNKQGDYGKALSRVLLDDELTRLFDAQRRFGNPHAGASLEIAIHGEPGQRGGLFWEQRPMPSVLSMLGHCTFEPDEYRAPKASFSAERHVWLTRLLNLRINDGGTLRPLTEAERFIALPLPYLGAEKFTYKNLRKALVAAGLPDGFRFVGMSYPSEQQKVDQKAKDPEEQVLVKLSGWHDLRLALKRADAQSAWEQISTPALEGKQHALDDIAWVLSIHKDDDAIEAGLKALNLPGGQAVVDVLMGIRFDGFHALSLKALRRIVPLMETGLRYDEAVARIPEYGHHSQRHVVGAGEHKLLPPFYDGRNERGSMKFRDDLDVPRNPVVLRALNQARKVVNALVKAYGSPTAVHIEMARDLSRPLKDRRDIEKLQEEYRERNERAREEFIEDFGRRPSGIEFEKWMLYREQSCKCAYSLEALDIHRVLNDPTYVQIDHALPYSRSYDDSKNNKVLALSRENQNKGNRTPYEYLDGASESERWRHFSAWVQGNKSYRQAKRSRLLRKNYGTDEAQSFKDRNLNDTRYICRFFKNYVEQHLKLADGSESRRCVVLNGQLTSFLRARWGLLKIREESDRHHAMDAAVVAACSHGMVKRLADHARLKELEYLREGFPDPETGEVLNPEAFRRLAERFPEPWPHFRNELDQRLRNDDAAALRGEMARLGSYPPEALQTLRPLFVSRMVARRSGGEVHAAKLLAVVEGAPAKAIETVPLTALTLAKLEKMVGRHDGRNLGLYDVLKKRLLDFGEDPKKAFAPGQPVVRKPARQAVLAPVVRSIKIEVTQSSGLLLRGGIADLGDMLRVEVYRHSGGYIVQPQYQAGTEVSRLNSALPNDAMFCFSLSKNELVEVAFGDEVTLGYFVMYESDGRMTLRSHDQPQSDKKFFRRAISKATRISKKHVDILGGIHSAQVEPRRGLA